MPHVLPVGIYLGFKGWMYWLWLVHVSPHVSALTTCSILAATLPVWATYLRCWLGDPGVISAPRQDKLEGVRSMFEGKRSVGCNILLHNIQEKAATTGFFWLTKFSVKLTCTLHLRVRFCKILLQMLKCQ